MYNFCVHYCTSVILFYKLQPNTGCINQKGMYVPKLRILLGFFSQIQKAQAGAQWLSGRVLDSRPNGSGFEPHWRHCVVVLEQDTFILA